MAEELKTKKLSELPLASALNDTDTLIGNQDGSTKRFPRSLIPSVPQFSSYAELRAYQGAAATVIVTAPILGGTFNRFNGTDDGGIQIGNYRRSYDGLVELDWWADAFSSDASASLLKALATGQPVMLPTGTIYANVSLPTGSTLIGRGKAKSIVQPVSGNTTTAITISGANSVRLSGFRVLGGSTAKLGETQGLINCINGFYNVQLRDLEVIGGAQCGIVMSGGANSNERSLIENCAIYSNRFDGIQISETKHVDVVQNQVHDNAHHGIALQPAVFPPVAYSIDDVLISGNRVYNNVGHGIYVLPLIMGGTSLTNFTYSFTEQQYCKDVRVSDNHCYSNAATGILAGGFNCTYTGNTCTNNGTAGDGYSGIVVAGYSLTVNGNSCTGNATYGIDIGGSVASSITGNTCSYNGVGKSFCIGLNVGASQFCSVIGNSVLNNGSNDANTFQLLVAGWDGDGAYSYELSGGGNIISGNNIHCLPNNYGLYVRRNVQYTQISNNYIGQGSRINALVNETDYSSGVNAILNNYHDISTAPGGVTIASAAALVIDDFNTDFIVTGTTNITSLLTQSGSAFAGKVSSALITNKGSGYTSKPTVTFSGGGGTGAAATVEIGRSGQVVALNFTNFGSGYTSPPTIAFSGGGGTGAAATAVVGIKNQAGRRITLQFEGVLTFNVFGMNSSYTSSAGSTLSLIGRKNGNGQWLETSRSA